MAGLLKRWPQPSRMLLTRAHKHHAMMCAGGGPHAQAENVGSLPRKAAGHCLALPADTVICMDSYVPADVTEAAQAISRRHAGHGERLPQLGEYGEVTPRTLLSGGCGCMQAALGRSETAQRSSLGSWLVG